MDAELEAFVRDRAKERCEYCHFPEIYAELPFQIDHIVARQHGGTTELENLALACCFCNRYKGPNLSGIDPLTGKVIPLFNPRTQRWGQHFQWDGATLTSRTPTGRATIRTLKLNRPDAVAVRAALIAQRLYPC